MTDEKYQNMKKQIEKKKKNNNVHVLKDILFHIWYVCFCYGWLVEFPTQCEVRDEKDSSFHKK